MVTQSRSTLSTFAAAFLGAAALMSFGDASAQNENIEMRGVAIDACNFDHTGFGYASIEVCIEALYMAMMYYNPPVYFSTEFPHPPAEVCRVYEVSLSTNPGC
jgi:hypothetical protein